MIEKWERQPGRIGMVMGFVALPLLWWGRNCILHLFFDYSWPKGYGFSAHYLIFGAIPGAICGRGLSEALFAWRQCDGRRTKSNLVWHGVLVFALGVGYIASRIPLILRLTAINGAFFHPSIPTWLSVVSTMAFNNFPLHCAFLMLFIGLLMRSRR